MCGIAGVFDHGRSEGTVGEALVRAMCETIRHRGPDGEGVWVSEDRRVGLGNRRLAILDVAGAWVEGAHLDEVVAPILAADR